MKGEQIVKTMAMLGKGHQSVEEHVKRLVNQEIRSIQQQQSAWTERGMLALVAAFGDVACLHKMADYIRTHYAAHSRQAKAMLEAIAYFDLPEVPRVLQSLAVSCRSAAIAKRARELLAERAEQLGWTEDELADHTLPDCGFVMPPRQPGDHSVGPPELTLNYGSRQFKVIVSEGLSRWWYGPMVHSRESCQLLRRSTINHWFEQPKYSFKRCADYY